MNLKAMTDLFAKLGARAPERWARSQVEEGIPQLERFVFLRQAWRQVVREDDREWIEKSIASSEKAPEAPYSAVGQSLRGLRQKGATDDELLDLVRGAQAELLFQICYLLDDPGELEAEVADIAWGLFSVDNTGTPMDPISGLHESVLETDPTGREMRRRGAG